MATDAIGDAGEDQPTTELVTGAVGTRCANCQAPLANDQRYCLNCGARRGKARVPTAAAAPAAPAAAAVPPGERRPRFSSAATLVAGVATLLIAMGVGVLIGHYSASPTAQKSAGIQVITSGSSGGASNTTTSGSSAPAQQNAPSKAAKASLKHSKVVVVHLTPKVTQKAVAAAAKTLGTNGRGNLTSNATEQVGQSCSGGAGCQNGKFTGNFFP